MTFGKPFEPGREKTGGRKLGVRNKLSERFLKDLHAEWEKSGEATLKILAKENPEAFARLALGVIPKEHEGLPPSVVVYTGVPRADDSFATLPSPPAALPAPKKEEPAAVPCPITSDDMVAELPKAPEPEVRKTEPLIYPKIVRPIGWR